MIALWLALQTPPDLSEEVGAAWASRLSTLNEAQRFAEALAEGARYQERVGPNADVAYEMGLAANRSGDAAAALGWYEEALRLRPNFAAAAYDRGELHLAAGRDEAAQADFEVAARARPDHWVGPFRLAQLAGRRADPTAFEEALLASVLRGFDLHTLALDPQWRAWAHDPNLGPILTRVILVYGDEATLSALRAP